MVRKQQEIWNNEHEKNHAFPSYTSPEPSSMVEEFENFLDSKGISSSSIVVDIGCGKGRNSIYMAKKGYKVFALDYIQVALEHAEKVAEKEGVAEKIKFINSAIDSTWPFDDNYFDVAIDCFASIDIETLEGREIYKKEMFRTLKPNGLAMVAVVSADDEYEKEMMQKSPGPEKNSTIWTDNGKFQKNYTVDELKKFYEEFKIVEIREISKKATKMGRSFQATNLLAILQKV